MSLLMRQCSLKHKECPLKRQLVGRVVRSLEIQVAKATNRQKNGSAEESIAILKTRSIEFVIRNLKQETDTQAERLFIELKRLLKTF